VQAPSLGSESILDVRTYVLCATLIQGGDVGARVDRFASEFVLFTSTMLPLQPGKALGAALVGRDGHHLADAEAVGVGNVVGVNNADAYAILRADLLQLIARWTVHVRGWQVAWKAEIAATRDCWARVGHC